MGGRNRVLSFMSAFGPPRSPQSSSFSSAAHEKAAYQSDSSTPASPQYATTSPQYATAPAKESPPPRPRMERPASRPMSMIQTYQPPLMEIAQDTIPELQPIFTFLNSHANKLYQEGYFLRLNDLDSHGRPHADRSWTESFAQLVGTVLSLWDAAALDAAGQDGEVAPTFINLADASIKMIETLPTRSADVQPLQNVLSISTAGKNRYLFHFNSLHSLTQWTAAIRLAMYENATLQEAYTGSLIAGKGKMLNNIKVIMERTKFKYEDWARVRFGAGTPWRRCWCVITPPDEKEVAKQQKQAKKKSAYERAQPLRGTVKFYDTKRITKKVVPIATINDAYSAYAIYPQSKPLIEQSTLIKVEGSITIHSSPDVTTEGFIFIMPETHAAVTGFEIMLRFLFPLYDVFTLYGRPLRLIADTLDSRSLMFALPQERRYGYLEILDVAGLIHEKGSQAWSEREWRKKLKELTSGRMTRMTANGRPRSRANSYRDYRNSLPSRGTALRFEDGASVKSTQSFGEGAPPLPPPHTASAPPDAQVFDPPPRRDSRPLAQHQRSFSENFPGTDALRPRSEQDFLEQGYGAPPLAPEHVDGPFDAAGRLSFEPMPPPPPHKDGEAAYIQDGPPPPAHGVPRANEYSPAEANAPLTRDSSSESFAYGTPNGQATHLTNGVQAIPSPSQVAAPPAFSHEPGAKPQKRPSIAPDLQRANSRLSITTLQQLTDAGKHSGVPQDPAMAGAAAAWRTNSHGSGGSPQSPRLSEDQGPRGVIHDAASAPRNYADRSVSEGMVPVTAGQSPPLAFGSRSVSGNSSNYENGVAPYYKDKPLMTGYDLLTPQGSVSRHPSPLSKSTTPSPEPQELLASLPDDSHALFPDPGSSFIEQSSPSFLQKPPPLQIDTRRSSPARSTSSLTIARKPVPTRSPSQPRSTPPVVQDSPRDDDMQQPRSTPSVVQDSPRTLGYSHADDDMLPRSDSLRDHYIDDEALAHAIDLQHLPSISSETERSFKGDEQSVYDDGSVDSPDYASTRKSSKHSQRSVETPRRGALKTVGTTPPPLPAEVQVGDALYRPPPQQDITTSADIPDFDFGPTRVLDPTREERPDTSGTLTQAKHERYSTHDQAPIAQDDYHSVLRSFSGQSRGERPAPVERSSSSRNLMTPEPSQPVQGSSPSEEHRKSLLWQPGTQVGGSPNSHHTITPEQYVQQRVSANRVVPVFAHGRQSSSSPTPPPQDKRQSSSEWPLSSARASPNKLQKRQSSYVADPPSRPHSRLSTANYVDEHIPVKLQKRQSSYSRESPARPDSRTASHLMNPSDDYSRRLSAREQEHVARVTGSPLVNVPGSKNPYRQSMQSAGLVGAIEAREKEKRDMKDGLSGHMVQQAIAQRQHHQQNVSRSSMQSLQQYAPQSQAQAQYAAQPQYAMAPPQPHYTMPGGYPPSPGQYSSQGSTPTTQQQQYNWPTQQQQQQYYAQQQQQQQPPAWTPPSAGQFVGQQQGQHHSQGSTQQAYYGGYYG